MSETPRRTMKDFDPEEQPREKAARHGCGVLTVPELLALILRTGTPGTPIIEMTRNLIDANGGSLHSLARRSAVEIMELAKRYFYEEESFRPTIIRSSADIHALMRFEIGNSPQEQIWLITLTRRNSVIGKHHLTTGSAVASIFDLKRALKSAILDEASGIILCHNHPSGNLRPSPQDDAITRALKEGAAKLDLRLLDHLIITAGGFYSYADEGRL